MKKIKIIIVSICVIFASCSSKDKNDINNTPIETNDGSGDNIDIDTTVVSKLLKKMIFEGSQNYSLSFYYNNNKTIDKIITATSTQSLIKQFYYDSNKIDRAEFQDLNGNPNGGIEKYIYKDGLLAERQDFNSQSNLDEKFVYTFENNKVSNTKYYGTNETEYSEQYIYSYGSNGILNSLKTDFVNNKFVKDYIYAHTYDDKVNPFHFFEPKIVLIDDFPFFIHNSKTEIKTNLPDNEVVSAEEYTYQYDNDNYPIKKISKTGTITFEYYD